VRATPWEVILSVVVLAPAARAADQEAINRSVKLGVAALKGTQHRLFAGGPVQPTLVLLLSKVKEPQPDMRSVFDGVYIGGDPKVLERIITQAKPADRFRAFAGYAGWAPGQLGVEMLQGSWAVLPPETFNIFDKDPATLWPDSLSQLQAPRVISN